jgi:glycosyltransferase involved in cell wall biosynthesis
LTNGDHKGNYRHNDLASVVSVIIPTMNSSKTIGKCLESVIQQTYKNIEIFVIDRFSSDDTTKIASKFNTKLLSIDGERTRAKNLGISESSGEFLLFIDSDMILEPQVIEECITICSNDNNIAGAVIPEHSIGSGFWVRVRDFERSLYAGSDVESARFFRRKFVVQVRGFDEDIIMFEESTLPQKIENMGMSVNARITSFILHDEEGFDLLKWLQKRRYYHSTTVQFYSKKYQKHARVQTSVYHRIKLFLSHGNWKALIRNPGLTIGVFILKSLDFLTFIFARINV